MQPAEPPFPCRHDSSASNSASGMSASCCHFEDWSRGDADVGKCRAVRRFYRAARFLRPSSPVLLHLPKKRPGVPFTSGESAMSDFPGAVPPCSRCRSLTGPAAAA
jgi:hypothetical protein